MSLIEYCLAQDQDIFLDYVASLKSWIATETEELRSQIPEHEWWKKEEVNFQEKDISLGIKYIFLKSAIIEKLNKTDFSKDSINHVFNIIESYLKNVNNNDEIDEIEVLFFEGIANYTENNNLNDKIYRELPKISKKIWDKNRTYWKENNFNKLSQIVRSV